MILVKEHTAYNGAQCNYHSIVDFDFNVGTGECDALVGSFPTPEQAVALATPIEVVRIQCHNVTPGDGLIDSLYAEICKDQRFLDAEIIE